MSDNQEEKIKFLIKKKTISIEDAIKKLGISKQTFYNNIRKQPISRGFKLKLKELLDINVEESLKKEEEPEGEYSKEYLIKENIRLHRKLESLLEEALKAEKKVGTEKDQLIELQKEIARLKEQLNKKSA